MADSAILDLQLQIGNGLYQYFIKCQLVIVDYTLKNKWKDNLTHKAPPITCSRRQFQILPIFLKIRNKE